MGTHRKIVGVLHIITGLMALVPVLLMWVIFGGAMGLVAKLSHGEPDAAAVNAVVGVGLAAVATIVSIVVGVVGAFSLAAGIGVMRRAAWGDVLAMISAALHVFNVPVGTALGVYTFWALLKAEPRAQPGMPVYERVTG